MPIQAVQRFVAAILLPAKAILRLGGDSVSAAGMHLDYGLLTVGLRMAQSVQAARKAAYGELRYGGVRG